MENNKLPLGYIGGDIMTHGSQLARQEECDKIDALDLKVEYYSPAQNKSINDKANMTEEENNHLAEKIVEADVQRLWDSDFTVMCAEQSALGTLVEIGILYGWKYVADKYNNAMDVWYDKWAQSHGYDSFTIEFAEYVGSRDQKEKDALHLEFLQGQEKIVYSIMNQLNNKRNYFHYSDIRTNHLNEKDWRRSFSINQFLYGCILAIAEDGKLNDNFDEVLKELKLRYSKPAPQVRALTPEEAAEERKVIMSVLEKLKEDYGEKENV